jgi:hypothetical protein
MARLIEIITFIVHLGEPSFTTIRADLINPKLTVISTSIFSLTDNRLNFRCKACGYVTI